MTPLCVDQSSLRAGGSCTCRSRQEDQVGFVMWKGLLPFAGGPFGLPEV